MGRSKRQLAHGIIAALLIMLAGWVGLRWPGLARWSFDTMQLFLPGYHASDLVIVYMDAQAMSDYRQSAKETWNRALHARLLQKLTRDGAKVVVFDVLFSEATEPAQDLALAEAIRQNGRVVLAGGRERFPGSVHGGYTLHRPLQWFSTNALDWGTAKVQRDAAFVVRAYDPGTDERVGLAWAAAKAAGAEVTQDDSRRLTEKRWLNYYGTSRPFAHLSMSYTNAEAAEAGFFRGKAVFIGGQPETLLPGEKPDVFGTPWTRWNNASIPGVEITAIAYANLLHADWMRRLGSLWEWIWLGTGAVLLTWSAFTTRRWITWALILAVTLGSLIAAVVLARTVHVWSTWVAVPLIQLPAALILRPRRRQPLERNAEGSATAPTAAYAAQETRTLAGASETTGGLVVSDHTLVRCIGEGAYGQVWIARNAIGLCHAVKVIYRSRFGTDDPFDRAFRGIQKFMPISRSHPGFIHVLHIGRDDRRGMFYYIMEAADDQRVGQAIEPETYEPRSLAAELRQRKRLPAEEVLAMMLPLTDALERLHQHQLIHRDIKPANIVFVNGQPKLADIDLVTDLVLGGQATRIGTQGYMAPEGPGTGAADVFSLGRVLYVALTGKSPDQCPELPTRLDDYLSSEHFMDLIQICCKACETDLDRRYDSAKRMREALARLTSKF